jgi:methylenetetrahydrofolate dehydrogenase (NADP+)/methenyltetrahydrofolate cyclohydrolase/formyltetrahydrofolate synthetase
MSSASHHAIIVTATLGRLEPLAPDKYMIALSRGSDQFFGTPNGYSATNLPNKLLSDVSAGHVKKIAWASYGSKSGSWFFAWELKDGALAFMVGPDIPLALRSFIQAIEGSASLRSGLRVQLGAAESFVAWSGTTWACANVPTQLEARLREGSSGSREGEGIINGSLRGSRTLDNVQWPANGSYYIKSGDRHLWNFQAKLVSSEWNNLWKGAGRDERMHKIEEELAVSIQARRPSLRLTSPSTFI